LKNREATAFLLKFILYNLNKNIDIKAI